MSAVTSQPEVPPRAAGMILSETRAATKTARLSFIQPDFVIFRCTPQTRPEESGHAPLPGGVAALLIDRSPRQASTKLHSGTRRARCLRDALYFASFATASSTSNSHRTPSGRVFTAPDEK